MLRRCMVDRQIVRCPSVCFLSVNLSAYVKLIVMFVNQSVRKLKRSTNHLVRNRDSRPEEEHPSLHQYTNNNDNKMLCKHAKAGNLDNHVKHWV